VLHYSLRHCTYLTYAEFIYFYLKNRCVQIWKQLYKETNKIQASGILNVFEDVKPDINTVKMRFLEKRQWIHSSNGKYYI